MKNYCKNLINTISFNQRNVRFCVTLQLGHLISLYGETSKELANKIISERKDIFNQISKGEIPDECKNCIYKDTYDDIVSNKIEKLYLYYWYHCNCGCFYCSFRNETQGKYSDKSQYGNKLIHETLKELYKQGQISETNLEVFWGGGEVGVLKEFPKLLDLFLKNNVKYICCDSSGIKYLRSLAKVLKKGKGVVTVAVCAGCRETYKKIKNRDKYNQVMKNLKKYVKTVSKHNNGICGNVISKYIILKGFNDNIEEVEKWLLESKKCGISQVEISIEFCWGIHTKQGQKIEDYNYEIFNYAQRRCNELGLKLIKNSTSMALMQQGHY